VDLHFVCCSLLFDPVQTFVPHSLDLLSFCFRPLARPDSIAFR
jgi:hypothetical protein